MNKPEWLQQIEASHRKCGPAGCQTYKLISAFNKSLEALNQWETWEGEFLMDHEAWSGEGSLPKFTQRLFDEYLKVQGKRNEALEAINNLQEGSR